ncbi:hypothetical protein NFI96_016881, partial [Prochilodus magdalenae]
MCSQLKKGKLRGRIDIGLSVMSIKKKAMCIDLDTEDSIYHLKNEGSKKDKKGNKKWKSRNHSKHGKSTLQASGSKSSRQHVSNPNLTYSEPNSTEPHLETPDSPVDASQLQEEFCRLAST